MLVMVRLMQNAFRAFCEVPQHDNQQYVSCITRAEVPRSVMHLKRESGLEGGRSFALNLWNTWHRFTSERGCSLCF